MNKTFIYILIVLLLAAGVWAWLNQATPQQEISVENELESITIETPNFEEINTDLETL